MEVFRDVCFCPMLKDVKFLPCLHPPTAGQLVDIIATMIENNDSYETEDQAKQYKRLALHMRRSRPEKAWMLGLLSTLHPNHELFQKGYRPPPNLQPQQQQQQQMIPNRNGFFDNLEPLSAKELRKKTSLSFLSKRERMQFELARINEREQKLQLAKAKKEADLQLLDDEGDDFSVKISLADFEVLKNAKLHLQANPMLFAGAQQADFLQRQQEEAQAEAEGMLAMGQ